MTTYLMLEVVDQVTRRVRGAHWLPEHECLRLDRQLGRLFDEPEFPVSAREKLSNARYWLSIFADDGQCVQEGGRDQVRRWRVEDLEVLRRLVVDATPSARSG